MTQDSFDTPYLPVPEPQDPAVKQAYWNTAFGLQKVDGLEPSSYFCSLTQEHVAGVRSLTETGELVRQYYREHLGESSTSEQEADLVSQRIAELLSSSAFSLIPDMLSMIHQALFQDLDQVTYQPGRFKEAALMKQEFVLNGDSVAYADPSLVQRSLNFLFEDELSYFYGVEFAAEDISHFARFISRLWQVHPFVEGNTRAVAVFAELYLNHLGFDVANEPFAKHARYFRDALVRANYRNAKAKILPTLDFLEAFFQNLVCGANNPLLTSDLVCPEVYDNPELLRNISPSEALSRVNPTSP